MPVVPALKLVSSVVVSEREQYAADMLRNVANAIDKGHPYALRERLINALAWLELAYPGTVPTLPQQIEALGADIAAATTAQRALALRNQLDVLAGVVDALHREATAKLVALDAD